MPDVLSMEGTIVTQARREADRVQSSEDAQRLSDAVPIDALDRGEVERRAYERYCARGCEDGHDLEDWLEAERALQTRPADDGASEPLS
jgi:hypothetical protein